MGLGPLDYLLVFLVLVGWLGGRREAYVGGMPDVVGSSAGERVVWSFCWGVRLGWVNEGLGRVRTDVVAAHVGGLGADGVVNQGCPVRLLACSDQVLAAVGHGVGEFHVVVHGFVDLALVSMGETRWGI